MKIIVIGGAGFIGSNVADAYVRLGHDVAVVDNLATGRRENVNRSARFYQVDIREAAALEEVFACERPQVVSHHAAQIDVRKSVGDPVYDATVNILGSINVIEAAGRCGTRKIIYASTGGAVYGEPKRLPADEATPVEPLCPYGISKHTVEHYLAASSRNGGPAYTVLRYSNVYGPRQDPHGEAGVVAIFCEQMISGVQPTIFGDGTKTRDYLFVADVVRANVLALDGGDNEILNLGWGKEVSDFEIFDGVRSALKVAVESRYAPRRPGEVEHISLDAVRAKERLGWEPIVTLKEGLRIAAEYYREKRAAAK